MVTPPAAPSAPPPALARRAAVFLPADPPRTGQVAFWRPDGGPVDVTTDADETAGLPTQSLTVAVPVPGVGTRTGSADYGIELRDVPAVVLPVAAALPVLTDRKSVV